ncbi:RloB family protein [Pasteurella multocida]|uniref:RloB family protein n=1 Tax=Pasteurella multocida TaxID=747 RepID=UPI00397C8FE8
MGCDDIFKKRKARKVTEKRTKNKRNTYDRVLIICEGEKTEPYYFRGLRSAYKLDSTNINITGDCDSSPMNIVEKAIEMYRISEKEGNCFDRVYCVFDKDSHCDYSSAIDRIRQLSSGKVKKPFFSICSVPCFEYWLLLHFRYTTRSFSSSGKNSIADNVIKKLKTYLPTYEKGQEDIFSLLNEKLSFAINNAKRANEAAISNDTDNPTTQVVGLVEYLIRLKE